MKLRFTELSRFVPEFVNTEEKRARRFQQGLKQWIQNRIAVFELTDYASRWCKKHPLWKLEVNKLKERGKGRKRKRPGGPGGSYVGGSSQPDMSGKPRISSRKESQ